MEARGRVGGRIYTVHDPLSPLPNELGAEFIHGRPPEIWNLVRSRGLNVYDVTDQAVHIRDGVIQREQDAWEPVNQIMSAMAKAAQHGPDEPFAEFLRRTDYPEDAIELSSNFVEGFNAARKEIIGIASLAKDQAASEQIDGDRSFRFSNGYDSIAFALLNEVSDSRSKLKLNTVVTGVTWRPGAVTIETRSTLTGETATVHAHQLIVTVPLGVLQAKSSSAGAIDWDPLPAKTLESAAALAFGQVYRVVLRFREAFWEDKPGLADAGFLLSNEATFPTWWTPRAVHAPLLTGWSAGPHADAILGRTQEEVVACSLAALARLTQTDATQIRCLLEQASFHDWYSDPFARGAYSYVPAGKLGDRARLAEPVENTLYFAGEATELNGHSATVHGAIASGKRAAAQVIASQGRA